VVTVALCPACGEGIDLEAAGEKCPRCGAPLPEQLRSAAQMALARRRPALITGLMVFFFIVALFWFAMLAFSVLFEGGTYTIGTERVTRDQFLLRAGPVLGGLGSLLLVTSYAFWKELAWGRHLACSYIVLAIVAVFTLMPEQATSGCALAMCIVPAAFLLWYFYAKPNVVRYYSQLRGLER
jgi:hypothetical protein